MAAVGVGKDTVEVAYDIPGMSRYLDLLNLMTYDMHGGWEDRTGCNAPLYATAEDQRLAEYDLSVSWAVDYWIANGASPSQLTIGLGMYGRGWTLTDTSRSGFNDPASGTCAPGTSTKEAGYLSYYEIEEQILRGATEVYDSDRECVYIVSGDEWVGYDNARSLCEKINFAKNRSLKGSMLWALDLDDMVGRYSGGDRLPLVNLAGSGGAACGSLPSPVPSPVTPSPAPRQFLHPHQRRQPRHLHRQRHRPRRPVPLWEGSVLCRRIATSTHGAPRACTKHGARAMGHREVARLPSAFGARK